MNKRLQNYSLLLLIILMGCLFFIKTSAAVLTSDNEVTFLAVGDIMLSRNVAAKISKAKNPLLPFSKMAAVLSATDFNIGNLESPFSGKDNYPKTGSLVFNVPRVNIQGLVKYNFKVLSLANNHALDQGYKGLIYTRNYLSKNNIQSVGVGENLAKAWQPALVDIKGVTIAFIGVSYASQNDNGKKKTQYVARIDDLVGLKKSITEAKQEADLVIVNMHAGTEYRHKPNQAQIDFAHVAVDNGADLVIGHHPHWAQNIEKYKGKYIFYSLGNFIFDQMWSTPTRQGLTIKFTVKVDKQNSAKAILSKAELMPVIIDNYSTPRLANTKEAKNILQSINQVDQAIDLN